MKFFRLSTCALFFLLILLAGNSLIVSANSESVVVSTPQVVFTGAQFDVTVTGFNTDVAHPSLVVGDQTYTASGDSNTALIYKNLTLLDVGSHPISLISQSGEVLARGKTSVIPAWASIIPPIAAIVIALLTRSVLPALFIGVWTGAWLAAGVSATGLWSGFMTAFDTHIVTAMADADHVKIILFTMMMGGMIGILSKNGGMQGIVKVISKYANTPRRGQLTTAGLGVAIFFDDVANTLLIGKTMQPVTDRLRISREKLAYIVDSTAAPLASIAFATTWIGYEVSVIASTVDAMPGYDEHAYSIFLSSLPYSFYPLLTLFFVFAIAFSGRDFGPMLRAEEKARAQVPIGKPDKTIDDTNVKPTSISLAVLPIIVLIVTLLATLYTGGTGDTLRDRLGSTDSFKALLWASFLGAVTAGALSLIYRVFTVEEAVEAWFDGVKSTFFAMIILVLAWTLSDLSQILDSANFLVTLLGDKLEPALMPTIIFILAAIIAFTTGTSWGTMGILMPLVIPLTWGVLGTNGLIDPSNMHVLYSSVAAVLAGATFGDHCSPISDTTILSSLASGCGHIEHVQTQMPYAIACGSVAVFICAIPVGYGAPWWLCLLAGMLVIWFGIMRYGKPTM